MSEQDDLKAVGTVESDVQDVAMDDSPKDEDKKIADEKVKLAIFIV